MEKERKKINKGILQGWTIIGMVLFLAYILEVVKGNRTIGYFLIFSIMDMGPLIASWMIYRKKQDSIAIRFLCAVFYSVLYVFVLWTGVTPLVFSYMLPMLYLLMLCNDTKLIGMIGAVLALSNFGSIAVQLFAEHKSPEEYMTEWEIQIAAAVLCAVFAFLASKISASLYEERMKKVAEGEKRLKNILERVNEVSGIVENDTQAMLTELDKLENASKKTAGAMEEIVSGSSQSTQMVETQLHMTANIQEIIDYTNTVSEKIGDRVEETTRKVASGIDNMQKLSESADLVEKNSSQVLGHMATLRETTEEVQDIISIINDIAGQTNLLALNASIEAARAGDAGRGFAVVADEINGLANQTREATQNIVKMVNTLREKAAEAVDAVQKMAELNKLQNEIIHDTDAAFGEIRIGVAEVKQNTDEEKKQMEKLLTANAQIVESIHTISAVSEEVLANTNQTQEITAENEEAVSQAAVLAKKLGDRVVKLKSYAAE